MIVTSRSSACLDDETLAAFAEGRLKRSEIPAVLAHLRECARCMRAVETANELAGTKEARPFRWRWAAVAAAVLVAMAIAVPLLRRDDPRARLVQLAGADARPVETRLTSFDWAPYRGPLRAGETLEDARRLQLAGAAGDAVARANADASPEAQWTAGVALLLIGQQDNALARLRAAAERAPRDAAVWSDLAATLDAVATQSERRSLHAEALAAAEHALSIDAAHPAALFNRALILEHLGLGTEARKAWNRYLAIDASSAWANEARAHLQRLPVSTGDARFRAAQTNLATVATLVPAFPQQSRTYAEGIYLGRWGETSDVAALDAARAIGEAIATRSDETLLRDAVHAIDTADGGRRAELAAAHAQYMRGRIALSKQEPLSAERDLRAAASAFARAGSAMALVARHYAATARFENGDAAGAREELEALRAECETHPGYRALRATIEWQLATIAMADADWARALEHLDESEARFRRLGERAHLGFIRSMQATALGCLGRPDEAWAARIEAFRALDAEGHSDRLPVAIGAAARMELHAGRTDTARAFLGLEEDAVRETKNAALLANALVREALLHVQLGDAAAATRAARDAMRAATSLEGALREIAVADARLAEGAATMDARALTSAIDFYRTSQRAVFLPQAYLLRARTSLRAGDRDAALRDLDEGIDVLERHRLRVAGPLIGTDILDAGTALEREAIRLRIAMDDVPGAFREAERRNLRAGISTDAPVAIEVVQQRLRGTSTALLMLSMQPDEAIAIAVTESEIAAARAPLDERTLEATIRGTADGKREDAEALYDALVRPSASVLQHARRLIVVADPLLREVPFAALHDRVSRRFLIESMPIAVAESASSLNVDRAMAPPLAVAVALPSGTLTPLPDAQRDLGEVASLYPRTVAMEATTFATFANAIERAGIVHVAGHTSQQRGTSDRALPFAGHAATWRDLSAMRFDAAPVVVLAACETLRQPDVRRTRALSLGSGVLAAGAGDAIGTLRPIADRDAMELFRDVHRGLASGLDAADALRRAQLDALASEIATGRALPWRAVALLTRRAVR